MTNAEFIQSLADKAISRIRSIMEVRGCCYNNARAIFAAESLAGPAVWAIVDAHFAA